MTKLFLFIPFLFATSALAHPNGIYEIDGQQNVTVEFEYLERCPTDVDGALEGGLRRLTFSSAATAEPYSFVTGLFVELHNEGGEVYVETDEQCVPYADGQSIPASRRTFAGYSLRKI